MNWNELEARPGIYKIKCTINDKVYIGLAKNVSKRIHEHFRDYKSKSQDKNLYYAMSAHGVENFEYEVVEYCSIEELGKREKYWIKFYKSDDIDYGFNWTKGGEGSTAYKNSKHYYQSIEQTGEIREGFLKKYDYYIYYQNSSGKRKYFTDSKRNNYTVDFVEAKKFKFEEVNKQIKELTLSTTHDNRPLHILSERKNKILNVFLIFLAIVMFFWILIYIVVGILTNFVSALIVFPLPFIIILGLIFPGKKK